MLRGRPCTGRDPRAASAARASNVHEEIALFLCGDVMTGRGIDQLLPRPCEPTLYEPYVTSANEYVALAENANGPLPRPVDFGYPWKEAYETMIMCYPPGMGVAVNSKLCSRVT